jgi:hypothetical protein
MLSIDVGDAMQSGRHQPQREGDRRNKERDDERPTI